MAPLEAMKEAQIGRETNRANFKALNVVPLRTTITKLWIPQRLT